jgi:aryl-alcohol dehydrogenase-like predicted oxidoreductase
MIPRRPFGSTGLQVSERSFGAWAIGGAAFGAVAPDDALRALARAEELGCNFIDTAAVYGESESLIGRFLAGRRDRWLVATKYSNQPAGMTALVEEQLRRLGVEYIDFYQIHWAPSSAEEKLYAELDSLKRAGKIRHAGVSLKSAGDLQRVLRHPVIDGVQLPVSLLDPAPLMPSLELLRQRRPAVIARSALRGGFLTGKYTQTAQFGDASDQRSQWQRSHIEQLAAGARAFGFLEAGGTTLRDAALAYPLSFPEVSTLVISCKSAAQVEQNLGAAMMLDRSSLERIRQTQATLGGSRIKRILRRVRAMLRGRH